MKPILLLLMILQVPLLLIGQREFAPIGAEWYYSKYISHNPPVFGYVKHTSIKDSIVQGKSVRVLEVTYIPNDTTATFLGYEYMHQKGDSIYYWKNNEFHLLYNFSMQKGDSVLLYTEMLNRCTEINDSQYGWNIVDSTYTMTVNGQDLRAYNTIPHRGSVWGFYKPTIEIVGNLEYLFPQNYDCIYDGTDWYGDLRCYTDESIGFFQLNYLIACDSTLASPNIVESITKQNVLRCYPNPTSNHVHLQVQDIAHYTSITAVLFNMWGKQLSTVVIDSNTAVFDLSHFPKGSYLILLKSDNKIIDYEKLIKK